MKYDYYEKKINDVIIKCPIESGIEILVYNLLDEIIDSSILSLVDINRLWKNRDDRLTTEGGIPDIAILSENFEYKTNIGNVYGFIEVKATNRVLHETGQIKGQKHTVAHYLYTNGLVWKYYKEGEAKWEIILASYKNHECLVMSNVGRISINPDKFEELITELNNINWF